MNLFAVLSWTIRHQLGTLTDSKLATHTNDRDLCGILDSRPARWIEAVQWSERMRVSCPGNLFVNLNSYLGGDMIEKYITKIPQIFLHTFYYWSVK